MNEAFHYTDSNGLRLDLAPGKIVAIGRNYHAHIEELKNPVPDKPVIFMKPATSLVPMKQSIHIPTDRGAVHHEIELAVLIGQTLHHASEKSVQAAIAGYAIALDLTLRDVQQEMKEKGLPWEMAKAWDGSCPLGAILPSERVDPADCMLELRVNDEVRQSANTQMMIRGAIPLISYISQYFTLNPGDLVLTGTPAGVASLAPGDRLDLAMDDHRERTDVIQD